MNNETGKKEYTYEEALSLYTDGGDTKVFGDYLFKIIVLIIIYILASGSKNKIYNIMSLFQAIRNRDIDEINRLLEEDLFRKMKIIIFYISTVLGT